MKKILYSISALAFLSSSAVASESSPNSWKTSGELKLHHILNDKDNGWAPNTGSAYMLKAKAVSPSTNGIKLALAGYINGDTGLTKLNQSGYKSAGGIFMGDATSSNPTETTSVLGEAYIEYKDEKSVVTVGRLLLDTPMTKNPYTTMPDFFEAATVKYKSNNNLSLFAGYISKMSYGARSLTNFSLIGEKTETAGATKAAKTHRGKFTNVGTIAGGNKTDGVIILGAKHTAKKLSTQAWAYLADDLVDVGYIESNYKYPLSKETKLITSAQYLGLYYKGQFSTQKDSSVAGLKLTIAQKNIKYFIAYNKSNEETKNIGAGDLAYTSSIFSRNAYRPDVNAYKVGIKYKIMKGLKLIASYANYGKSSYTKVTSEAKETDFILLYKPNKQYTIKLFNAIRTSEFNSSTLDRTQNHSRIIVSFKF